MSSSYGYAPPKAWGLYKKDSPTPFPLKSLDISIKILHNIAQVFYTQVYRNNSGSLLESEFFFPISPDACFDSFEAKFNDTTIKGIIKEKEKAKEEYKQAIQEGRTAAYSEIQEETGDIMKVLMGNIPPQAEITVTYSYIQKLETSLNKFWCFRLFSTITPRYNGNLNEILNKKDINLLSNYPTISEKNSKAYPWTIKAEIQSPEPITFLKSPSHEVVTEYGNEKHTCTVTLNPKSTHFPNKDFVLLYTNGKEDKVDYLITPFEDGYCAMVNLLTDFEKTSEAETYDNFVKAKEVKNQHGMDTITGEYIFLIDRSGSMEGDRIQMARNSLCLFLKSLPQKSFFNIVSFGSSYNQLYRSSKEYSQESFESAVKEVETFQADMGGTEIYQGLKAVFDLPLHKGYPRSIFLLTDGAVSNTYNVLDLIKENSDKARTYTIGIGNGCSPELITKGASYGKGKHEFVSNNNQIFEKVISLLNASLSPCYSDLSLEANNFDAVVKSISPNPAEIPFLLNGQTVTFFLFLRKEAFQDNQKMSLKLRMYDTRVQKYRTVDVTLDSTEALENDSIPKLGIHDMIKRLEAQKEGASQKNKDILWLDKAELKKTLVEFSIKHGVLCKETAFFCDIKENDKDVIKSVEQEKIVIPTISSHDYSIYSQQERFRSLAPLRMMNTTADSFACGSAAPGGAMNSYACKSAAPDRYSSLKLSASARSEPKGAGLFSGLAQGVSNAFGALFSKKEKKSVDNCMAPTLGASNSYGLSNTAPSSTLSNTPPKYSPAPSISQPKTGSSYLDVIMKQKFEGCWDPTDQQLRQTILKTKDLPEVPKEVKDVFTDTTTSIETVWITILVLLWLEVACKGDSKAWSLIHQKGCEWLKNKGMVFEDLKGLGNTFIKV